MAASQQETQQTKRMFTPKIVIIILVLVLLIAGMGVGGLIYFKSTADGEKKSGPDPEKLTTFSMGSLLVNLADPSGNNFMRLTPVLEYEENKENKKLAEELAKNKIVLQDTIIRSIRKKKLSDVEPPNSIDKVALELQTEINKKLSEGSIYRIYFAEYLTQ